MARIEPVDPTPGERLLQCVLHRLDVVVRAPLVLLHAPREGVRCGAAALADAADELARGRRQWRHLAHAVLLREALEPCELHLDSRGDQAVLGCDTHQRRHRARVTAVQRRYRAQQPRGALVPAAHAPRLHVGRGPRLGCGPKPTACFIAMRKHSLAPLLARRPARAARTPRRPQRPGGVGAARGRGHPPPLPGGRRTHFGAFSIQFSSVRLLH